MKNIQEYKQDLEKETLEKGLMKIELNHTKTLLDSCEKVLEERDEQIKRMYNEKEIITLLQKYRFDLSSGITPIIGDTTKEWFEQFKKK